MSKVARYFCLTIGVCITSSAFSTIVSPRAGSTVNQAVLILNDFQDATSANSTFSPSAVPGLSTAGNSHLMSLASLNSSAPPRKHVNMPEPDAVVTWAIDLAGLGGLVLFVRRRSAVSSF